MIQSLQTAQALIRDLGNKLSVRFANGAGINTVAVSQDASGNPMLFLSVGGNVAEGQPVIAIRISQESAVSTDVFNNPLLAYTPHIMDFAYELASANDPEPTLADIAVATWESINCGVRWQLKTIANGTAVTATSMNAATPVADLDSLYWPTKLA